MEFVTSQHLNSCPKSSFDSTIEANFRREEHRYYRIEPRSYDRRDQLAFNKEDYITQNK